MRLTSLGVLPGLLLACLVAAAAYVTHALLPGLNVQTAAVLLGVVVANVVPVPGWTAPGLRFASHSLLRLAIVLLGLQLSLHEIEHLGWRGLVLVVVTVSVAFFGTLLLARPTRVSPLRGTLVAAGFSICGVSAVGAVAPVVGADDDDVAVSAALVTLCGSLAIVVLPLLQHVVGLPDAAGFGTWVGASVHDVGQTVATAARVPGALTNAVIVKLTRVLLLAPVVLLLALRQRRLSRTAGVGDEGALKRPAPVPLFVAGFILAVLVASTGLLPGGLLSAAKTLQTVCITIALASLGLGIRLPVLRRRGPVLALGLLAWLLVAGVSLVLVRGLGLA
ncbi:MAG: YeiH family protein [Actinomycetales bacterium]